MLFPSPGVSSRIRESTTGIAVQRYSPFLDLQARLSSLGISPHPSSRIKQYFQAVEIGNPDLNLTITAQQELAQIALITSQFGGRPPWKDELLQCIQSDLAVPASISDKSKGRDTQFELYVAARMRMAGLGVQRQEPDLLCQHDGITFGIAAKRIKSRSKLLTRISEARDQIIKSGFPGFIALDLSPLQSNYYKPYQIKSFPEFTKLSEDFLDIEFESKTSEIRRSASHPKVIGIISFAILCALDKGQKAQRWMISPTHNGYALHGKNSAEARFSYVIVDRLGRYPRNLPL
ncbi:MAG: hypothetical protein QM760_20340 [Nibricoccus sp.]